MISSFSPPLLGGDEEKVKKFAKKKFLIRNTARKFFIKNTPYIKYLLTLFL
jgi:hypothetical protein